MWAQLNDDRWRKGIFVAMHLRASSSLLGSKKDRHFIDRVSHGNR